MVLYDGFIYRSHEFSVFVHCNKSARVLVIHYIMESGDDMLQIYSNTCILTKEKLYYHRKKKKKSKTIKGIEIHEDLELSPVKGSGHTESSKKKEKTITREHRGAVPEAETWTEDGQGKVRIDFVTLIPKIDFWIHLASKYSTSGWHKKHKFKDYIPHSGFRLCGFQFFSWSHTF